MKRLVLAAGLALAGCAMDTTCMVDTKLVAQAEGLHSAEMEAAIRDAKPGVPR